MFAVADAFDIEHRSIGGYLEHCAIIVPSRTQRFCDHAGGGLMSKLFHGLLKPADRLQISLILLPGYENAFSLYALQ